VNATTDRCQDCGLPLVECSALTVARLEAAEYLRRRGYTPREARERAAALIPEKPLIQRELAKLPEETVLVWRANKLTKLADHDGSPMNLTAVLSLALTMAAGREA